MKRFIDNPIVGWLFTLLIITMSMHSAGFSWMQIMVLIIAIHLFIFKFVPKD